MPCYNKYMIETENIWCLWYDVYYNYKIIFILKTFYYNKIAKWIEKWKFFYCL